MPINRLGVHSGCDRDDTSFLLCNFRSFEPSKIYTFFKKFEQALNKLTDCEFTLISTDLYTRKPY